MRPLAMVTHILGLSMVQRVSAPTAMLFLLWSLLALIVTLSALAINWSTAVARAKDLRCIKLRLLSHRLQVALRPLKAVHQAAAL